MEVNLNDNLWELFNEYSFKGVMIISHSDFKKEIEKDLYSERIRKTCGELKMNAQQIINECNTQKFNPKQFRKEMNISWLINDVIKQFKERKNDI